MVHESPHFPALLPIVHWLYGDAKDGSQGGSGPWRHFGYKKTGFGEKLHLQGHRFD
jgi:hypothetical protein